MSQDCAYESAATVRRRWDAVTIMALPQRFPTGSAFKPSLSEKLSTAIFKPGKLKLSQS